MSDILATLSDVRLPLLRTRLLRPRREHEPTIGTGVGMVVGQCLSVAGSGMKVYRSYQIYFAVDTRCSRRFSRIQMHLLSEILLNIIF